MNADYQYIVGHLQSALATDPRVSLLDVKVMVIAGKIHLMGEVNSDARRQAVEAVVFEHFPELEVRNELTTLEVNQPGQPEVIRD